MMTAKQAKAIAERYQKAVELVEAGRVAPVYGQNGVYVVLNGDGVAYLVDVARETCTCPDYQYRAQRLGVPCKHQLAVALYRERQPDPDGGGRGRSPRRRYQPVDEPEPERCELCGAELDEHGECGACIAAHERTYGGALVRDADGVTEIW